MKNRYNVMLTIGFVILNATILTAACFGVERFLVRREHTKNIEITKGMSHNILDVEKQIERTLKNTAVIFEEYLKNHPNPITKELLDFSRAHNNIMCAYHDQDGILKGTYSGALEDKRAEYFKTYSVLKHINNPDAMKKKDRDIIILPIIFSGASGIPYKAALVWNKKLNRILNLSIQDIDVKNILDRIKNIYSYVLDINLLTPSGHFITGTNKFDHLYPMENYENAGKISNDRNTFTVHMSFGGIQEQNNIAKQNKMAPNTGLTNSKGEYYYNLLVVFNKKSLNHQIVLIRILFTSIFLLIIGILHLTQRTFKQRQLYHESIKQQAQQIHHDICSPLQAVDWGIKSIIAHKQYDENKMLQLRNATGMVKGIIHDLYYLHDNKFSDTNLKPMPELLYPIVESVIASASLLTKNDAQIIVNKSNDWNILVNVESILLRRALLNLVKNSIESLNKNGILEISFAKEHHNAVLIISDNGIGMNEEVISKLLNGKSVIDKKDTSRGLGFPYAKKVIEGIGGKIELESELNKGTRQIITIPIELNKPNWFIDKLNLDNYKQIVIFDDDLNIHEIYKQRFSDKKLIHISFMRDFENIMKDKDINNQNTFFFIDYALDVLIPNGIELIKQYQLENNSVLLTSMYLERKIKERCCALKIKILPKGVIEFI